MPRAFSSGALSIWSKADASLRSGYLSCSTLVIAAVSVVLPWSMCPMVPMLTCGLVRSNLALATGAPSGWSPRDRGASLVFLVFRPVWSGLSFLEEQAQVKLARAHSTAGDLLPARLLDDLVGDRLGRLCVGVELHRVRRLAGGL